MPYPKAKRYASLNSDENNDHTIEPGICVFPPVLAEPVVLVHVVVDPVVVGAVPQVLS